VRGREGTEWVVREGVGAGGEMTQALYAHMNNKKIKIKKKLVFSLKLS
jgi:NaMN:DMB phosphoribosyltransferase